jgi:short subunit dehydrogenase-like uncharacterized protein
MNATKTQLMIYGANGYSAKLVLEELLAKNIKPILAGRRENEIKVLAEMHSCDFRIFDLDDNKKIIESLSDVHTLLNCAGPYKYTAKDLIDACLENGTNYLDITGEMPVFALAFSYDSKAKEKGISILPGVGFDIIPTDCLAKRMKEQLSDATDLKLAFLNTRGKISRGTMLTTLDFLGGLGKVRREGKILNSEIGEFQVKVKSGDVSFNAVSIPWGDVFTAYFSTGIPNITVYFGISRIVIFLLPGIKYFLKLLSIKWIKKAVQNYIHKNIIGPTDKDRKMGEVFVWCKVENDKGESLERVYRFMEGYTLTAKGAAECALRVANGHVKPGTYTPSMAFGSDFMNLFVV